jgi:YD repeat-containing protein
VNSKGQLTSVGNSVSTYSYTSFDARGRVRGSAQTTNGVVYAMPDYKYDLVGNLTSEAYPSGRVVQTEFDAAGRLAGVRNQATGLYYVGGAAADAANRIRYAAHGAVTQAKLGNGLWEHTIFNSRLQPTQIGLGQSGTDSGVLRLDYGYGTADNNMNVKSLTITVPGAASPYVQTYGYDAQNRLQTAEESANATTNWKQVYAYDRYGNRTTAAGTTYPAQWDAANSTQVSAASNRLTSAGYVYDTAGNMVCDLTHPCAAGQSSLTAYYTYDAENRMAAAGGGYAGGGTSYAYDGDGRRVRKSTSNGETTVFVYDAAGRVVAEYAEAIAYNGTSYLTADSLGSTRIVTDKDGGVRARRDYLPFGEELQADVCRNNHYSKLNKQPHRAAPLLSFIIM